MDEDSATTHDPAARLGRATDVPDGIERLGAGAATGPLATARPAAAAWPTRWAGDESDTAGAVASEGGAGEPAGEGPDNPRSGAGRAEPLETGASTEAGPEADVWAEVEGKGGGAGAGAGRGDADDALADDDDPPPRWAARPELRITPRSAVGTAPAQEDEAPPAPTGPGRRSTYWAVAVLVAFGVIAGIGLIRGGGTDEASTDDRGAATTERSEASGSGAAGEDGEGDGDAATSTATTAAETRPPDVGECATVDTSTPPGEYVHVPCGDPRATLQLTQKVPAPAPPGSHCPTGTDSVTQVSDEVSGETAVAEFWCLRNVNPPHPGDPGGGSGELVVGDCLGVAPSSQSIEVPCDGTGLPPEFVVGWMPDAAGNCPAEADASINLEVPFPAKYCLRYA